MDAVERNEDNTLEIPILQGWDNKDPNEKLFSFNELTDIYLIAKEHGKKEIKKKLIKESIRDMNKVLVKKFESDIINAQKKGVEFYNFIIDNEIKIKQLHLKIESPDSFKLLYVLAKKSFFSDKFNKISDESHRITDEIPNLDISFMPYDKSLNTDKLLSDGYAFSYASEQ